MKIINITTTIFFTSILAACGGGGESSTTEKNSPPPSPPFSISVASNITEMDENESGQITLSYKNATGSVSLSIDTYTSDILPDSYVVTESNSDQAVTVQLNELTYNGTVSFVITGTDSNGKTDSETITFPVNNPSALPKIEQLEVMATAMPELLEASQERRILSTLIELGVMTAKITNTVANARLASIEDSFDADLKASLQSYVDNGDWRSKYDSSTIDETHLDDAVFYIKQELGSYIAGVNTVLQTTQSELTDVQVPSFIFDGFYLTSNGVASQFWGNPTMGSQNTEGEWQFNSNYAFLTALIFPELLTCNAQEQG